MGTSIPGLAGHKGLRGDILLELKRAQPLAATELAETFGVSANAVRRHLKELELEGLVLYRREQRGTGAPTYVYRLSENGQALFPSKYGEALTDVLAYVARESGREAVREMFAERFRAQAERLCHELVDASLEERVSAVVDVLSQQGFMAQWTVESDGVRLAEHHCAVRRAAEQFPEICAAEVDFLREVLGSELTRESYIPDGCNACQYTIALDANATSSGRGSPRAPAREEV